MYVLFYEVVDDFVNKRLSFRPEHLEHIRRSVERGDLLLAGAMSDPVDGALLIFRAQDPSVAEKFASSDPYVLNGLVKSWRVRNWNVVAGTAM